ncbi:DNA-binding GntR family transcriptional regulator [Thermocatellispora tengchongensis]|uniref:DNA-binding GntR family transcriptional regulator n=1 Tax=Thermocatellispora tengchongensis TaxID=1073253 RepID=A0A840PDP8_9ACTN|nr:GntR family transcriptional regulator [Thermocatellispora tengchongensis]MBB5136856.1 DNA-binding GntR family transcriptional regulator [Thermocatellispora tengchongensis]
MPARPKLSDEVIETLRQAILSGAYPHGAKLGLEELAEELGVSIMPVREALIALANEGLVVAEPRRGFRASPPEQQDIDDIFEIQAHLAGILAARAAKVATEEDIARLRDIHERFAALSEEPPSRERSAELGRLNTEFHRQINKLPPGDRVRWFLRLANRFVRQDLFESVPGVVEGALQDHPAIIEAIEARDSERARRLVEEHFTQGASLLGCTLLGSQ